MSTLKILKCKICGKKIKVFTQKNLELARLLMSMRGDEGEVSDQDLLETAFSELGEHYQFIHPDFYKIFQATLGKDV